MCNSRLFSKKIIWRQTICIQIENEVRKVEKGCDFPLHSKATLREPEILLGFIISEHIRYTNGTISMADTGTLQVL